ncbi:MAG: hypothetical protein ACRYE9_03605, partial [Janthinobacterium lividum]
MKLKKPITKKFLLLYIIFAFLLNLYLLYPGNLFPDSCDQFKQAINGAFESHHPSMMTFWWSIMMKIWLHPAAMFIFHLVLLWAASFNFYKMLEQSKAAETERKYNLSIIYLLLPLLPWILFYSFLILKDVSFAYSYLFVASMLARFSTKQEKFTPLRISLFLLFLFYGTAVKYQARFVLPILSWWFASIMSSDNFYKKLSLAIATFCLIYFCQTFANNLLVKNNESNSWQLVKFYDLAAISTEENKEIVPNFTLKSEVYDFNRMKKVFNHYSIDSLFYGKTKVFVATNNNDELKELYNLWFQTVIKYPKSYIKQRLRQFKNTFYARAWLNTWPTELDYPAVGKKLTKFLSCFSYFTSLRCWIFFSPLYLILGIIMSKKFQDQRGKTLIMMNLCVPTIVVVLVPFSVGSDARQLLIAVVMLNYSHPIALSCINTLIKTFRIEK